MDDGAVVFMDTETLGLDRAAPIWEFAAVRRNADGTEEVYHHLVDHSPYKHVCSGKKWADDLPGSFREDYEARWDLWKAITPRELADELGHIYRGRAHTVGAVPGFDTERLDVLLAKYGKPTEPWHYHLIDVENMAVGFLAGRGTPVPMPWNSDQLSMALGVDPEHYARHTALGDVRWEMAQWDAMMGPLP